MRRLKLARLEQKYGRPAVMFTCAVAVLIWLKLRLVTGVPRSVYAEPGLPTPEQSAKEREVWLREHSSTPPEVPAPAQLKDSAPKPAPVAGPD